MRGFASSVVVMALCGLGAGPAAATVPFHIDIAVSLNSDSGRLQTDFCLPRTDGCDRLPVLLALGFSGTTLPIDLQTGKQIFVSDFGDFDGGPFRVDDPGFISGVGLLPRDMLLRYEALGRLEYWDPAAEVWSNAVPQDARIRLAGGLSEETVISTDPAHCGGLPLCTVTELAESSTTFTGAGVTGPPRLIIDRTDASGTLHSHLDWRIEQATGGLGGAVGGYLLELALAADGLQSSLPLYILFNRGMNPDQFKRALASRILLAEVDLSDPAGGISGTVVFGAGDASGQTTAPLSGPGSLVKRGRGRLELPGVSTYTGSTSIEAGELAADLNNRSRVELSRDGEWQTRTSQIGSLHGEGLVVIEELLMLGLDDGNSSFTGQLTGNGQLQKRGAGLFSLDGAISLRGGVSALEGTLQVHGRVAGPITVAKGARLGGSGSITSSVVVEAGGWLAPGASIGTLTVGDLNLAPGAVLEIEVNPAGESDRIVSTGTVSLDGATLAVLAEAGVYAPSTTYTVIEAATGVTGEFVAVTSTLAYLSPRLSYTSEAVLLSLIRNNLGLLLPGQTPNQARVATALAGVQDDPDLKPLVARLLMATPALANASFDELSAPIYGLTPLALREADQALGRHLRDRLWSGFETQWGGLGLAAGDALGDRPRVRFWLDALGAGGARANQNGAQGFDYWADGLVAGSDVRLGRKTRLGLALAYRRLAVDGRDSAATSRGEAPLLALSAQRQWGALEWRGVVAVGSASLDTERQVLGQGYTASHSVLHGFLSQELAVGLRYGFTPYLSLDVLEQAGTDLSESGPGPAKLDLSLPATHSQTLEWGLRHRYASDSVVLETELGWRRQFGDTGIGTRAAFALAPEGSFGTQSVSPARNALALGLGLESDPNAEVQVQGRARVVVREREDVDHVVSAGLRLQW